MQLQTLGRGQGYLKSGFLGFNASGKTYTMVLLAIGLWEFMGKKGRILFFDTEGGSEYISDMIEAATKEPLIGIRSRSFSDLMDFTKEVRRDDIVLADSISHPWTELCTSYLAQINEALRKRNLRERKRLEFQDWNVIKPKWGEWTEWYLNVPAHVIICGRAGWEYEMEMNEETNKRELVKTGIKMKTETEFGFEPSLLIEMERVQVLSGLATQMVHRATVIKDRYHVIDGSVVDNPTFDFFLPHIKRLVPNAHAPIDTALKTDMGVSEDGDGEFAERRRQRTILCEEIQGLLVQHYPGQTQEDKKRKMELINQAFGTRSWTKVEGMGVDRLRSGLETLKRELGTEVQDEAEEHDFEKPMQAAVDLTNLFNFWKWSPSLQLAARGIAAKYAMGPVDFSTLGGGILSTMSEPDALAFFALYGYTREAARILTAKTNESISDIVAKAGHAVRKPFSEATDIEIIAAIEQALKPDTEEPALFVVSKGE